MIIQLLLFIGGLVLFGLLALIYGLGRGWQRGYEEGLAEAEARRVALTSRWQMARKVDRDGS